jgi:hypothetical protein
MFEPKKLQNLASATLPKTKGDMAATTKGLKAKRAYLMDAFKRMKESTSSKKY